MGLFDTLLRFFATADLIGATKAMTSKGQAVLVHRNCGMSGRKIERLLKNNGVRVKNVLVLTRQNLLHIVVDDYNKASQVLRNAGISVQ